jgi:hypothetical protein
VEPLGRLDQSIGHSLDFLQTRVLPYYKYPIPQRKRLIRIIRDRVSLHANDRSHEETDDPLYADRRNFYKGWSACKKCCLLIYRAAPTVQLARGVKGADMKFIVAAAVLSVSLCSCSAYNDRSVHRNLVGPTVVGDGNSVLVSHVRNQTDGQQLAEKHCKRFRKSARFTDGRRTSIFRLPIPFVNVNC